MRMIDSLQKRQHNGDFNAFGEASKLYPIRSAYIDTANSLPYVMPKNHTHDFNTCTKCINADCWCDCGMMRKHDGKLVPPKIIALKKAGT